MVDVYNYTFDEVEPWTKFEKAFNELDKLRAQFSTEVIEVLDQTKNTMVNGMDTYFKSIQSVYEWSGLAENAVKTYISHFEKDDASKTEEQKKVLIELLENGKTVINKALNDLKTSSYSTYELDSKLSLLSKRLSNQFGARKDFYRQKLKEVMTVNFNIRQERHVISSLRTQAGITQSIISIDVTDKIIESANKLSKACKEFRERHSTTKTG